MRNRKAAVSGFVLAAVAFAGACSDVTPTEPAIAPDAPALFGGKVDNPTAHAENTRDAHWARIAQDVPGFAGYYTGENGALTVMMAPVVSTMSASQVRQALGTRLAPLGVDLTAQPVSMVPAQYDFAQLHAMHRQAAPVLGLAGVVFTDADEVANRVRIGVENAAARSAVEAALAQAGVPSEAVVITETAPIELMQTLRDRLRPVGGGAQIVWPGSGANEWFVCTLGFNVQSPERPNVRGFVTNSHCTTHDYGSGPLGTPFYQNLPPALGGGPNNLIGTEVHDLPTFTGGACPAGRVCRWSDAAGVQYNSATEIAFARIHRVTAPGSLTIDQANPTYTITAERPFPNVGNVMNKIGRTTGWSQGPVTASCQNVNVGGVSIPLTLLCQERVTATVQGGDSGSPVFDFEPGSTTNVRLTGILWGGGGGDFIFSAMSEIRFENQAPAGLSWRTF